MQVHEFESWMRDLIAGAKHPEIAGVRTFAAAGLDDKPCGLEVRFLSGAKAYIQFVRTSPPAGSASTPDYYGVKPENRL